MGNLLLSACMLGGMEEEEGGYARPKHLGSGKCLELRWWLAGPWHFSGFCIAYKPGKMLQAQHRDLSIWSVHTLVCENLKLLLPGLG